MSQGNGDRHGSEYARVVSEDGPMHHFVLGRRSHERYSIPIGEPVHLVAVKEADTPVRRGPVRIYINGFRVRRPHWLWQRINRMRERRFDRHAVG